MSSLPPDLLTLLGEAVIVLAFSAFAVAAVVLNEGERRAAIAHKREVAILAARARARP